MAKRAAKRTTLADLTPDPKQAREHTPRNIGLIVDALHEVGAARSIVIDEDDVVLAGNGTVDAAAIAGIENVKVVEADGNTIIAVRRSGLTDEQKLRLALYDNRTAELADWDPEMLAAIASADQSALAGLFTVDEFESIIDGVIPEGDADDPFGDFGDEHQQQDLVAFKFGDYKGLISRPAYDEFVRQVQTLQMTSDVVMLDEVLRKILDVKD